MLSEYTVNRVLRPYEHVEPSDEEKAFFKFLPDQQHIEQMKERLRTQRVISGAGENCISDHAVDEQRKKDIDRIANRFRREPWRSRVSMAKAMDMPLEDVCIAHCKAFTVAERSILPFIFGPPGSPELSISEASERFDVSPEYLLRILRKHKCLHGVRGQYYMRLSDLSND